MKEDVEVSEKFTSSEDSSTQSLRLEGVNKNMEVVDDFAKPLGYTKEEQRKVLCRCWW